jgi:hypothetical protein
MLTGEQPKQIPPKQKLKNQILQLGDAINTCKNAVDSCKEIQEEYADKELKTIGDLEHLKKELERTLKGVLHEEYMKG